MLSGLNPSLRRWLILSESPCCIAGCPWIMDVFNHQYTMRTYRNPEWGRANTKHTKQSPSCSHRYTQTHTCGEKWLWSNHTFETYFDEWEDNLRIKEVIMGEEYITRVVISSLSLPQKNFRYKGRLLLQTDALWVVRKKAVCLKRRILSLSQRFNALSTNKQSNEWIETELMTTLKL